MTNRSKQANAEPWSSAHATDKIREKARSHVFRLCWKKHTEKRLKVRNLIVGDVLFLLKEGYVYDEAVPGKNPGFYKYKMEGMTPNSKGRSVCVVVIPHRDPTLTLVTVMWSDEKEKHGS